MAVRTVFWISVGVTAGVIGLRKLQQYRDQTSAAAVVEQVADKVAEAGSAAAKRGASALQVFVETFRNARDEREEQLAQSLLAPGQVPATRHGGPAGASAQDS